MKRCPRLLLFLLFLLATGLHAEDEWTLQGNRDGIRAYTRFTPGSANVACRVVCEIEAPLEAVRGFLLDTRMTTRWYRHLKECRELKRNKDGRELLYYFVFQGIWPVADRDLVASVHITRDDADEFACEMTALNQDSETLVPLNKKYVRVTDSFSTFRLVRVEKNRTLLQHETMTNPSGMVPAFLVNRYMARVPFQTLRDLRSFLVGTERYCKVEG